MNKIRLLALTLSICLLPPVRRRSKPGPYFQAMDLFVLPPRMFQVCVRVGIASTIN